MITRVIRDLLPKLRPHASRSWALYDNPRLVRRELWHQGRIWECVSRATLRQLRCLTQIGAYSYFDIARIYQPGMLVGDLRALRSTEEAHMVAVVVDRVEHASGASPS